MKCERCGKELSGLDLYCDRCGQAIFPEYMDETDVWTYYKSDEELEALLEAEKENAEQSEEKQEDLKETVEEVSEEELEETSEESQCPVEEEEKDTSAETEDVCEGESIETLEESPKEEPSEEILQEKEESAAVLPEESDQEWNFEDDEEEEEDDEESVITPAMKKSRRLRRMVISLFLIVCLAIGFFIGYRKMAKMDQQEKEYYKKLNKPVKEEEKPSEEPVEEGISEEAPAEETPVEETPEEEIIETKQEYFISVDPEGIDFSQYTKLQPASTEENSVKQSESYDYSARSAVDGDISTSWQENEEGTGEGKGFQLNLDAAHKVRYIVLHLGNWRSDQLWDYNARPKSLTIQVGDQQVKDVEFSNEKKRFCISFDEPIEASYISMYIKEAYEGSRWQDNCISEIEIYE